MYEIQEKSFRLNGYALVPSLFLLLIASFIHAQDDAPIKTLPLEFELSVLPDTEGSSVHALFAWHWDPSHRALLEGNWQTETSNGELPDYGSDSLYTSNSVEGRINAVPWTWEGSGTNYWWSFAPGLGLCIESLRERGTYVDMGTQAYDNQIFTWRTGPLLRTDILFSWKSIKAAYEISLVPIALYGLDRVQSSTLIAEDGTIHSISITGPEISHCLSCTLFELFHLSLAHQFLWVSVQRLELNETGDAWTSIIEGTQNHIIRAMGSVDVPIQSAALRIGLGWKQHWSLADTSGTAVLDSGLIFELLVTTKSRRF